MQANPKRLAKKVVRSLFKGKPVSEQKNSAMPKSVGVLDTNVGFDHAYRFAQDGLKVYFCIPKGPSAFPLLSDFCTGDGLLTKAKEPEDFLGKVDFVFVTDCFFGKKADDLRGDGIDVFGPSRMFTEIENNRIKGWNKLKEWGVGVPDGVVVYGIDELRAHVKKNGDGKKIFFPKLNEYRGNGETGSVMTDTEVLIMMSQLNIGPYINTIEMLVQDQCPGVEVGFDAFFNGEEFIRPFLYTIEIKRSGTVGVWIEENGIEQFIFDPIKPYLKASGYRGNISFEFFWDGVRIYAHDPTARLPYPCSTIYAHFVKNYSPACLKVAQGKPVSIKVDKKYAAQINIYNADHTQWGPIHLPEKIKDRVGFRRIIKQDGSLFYVPGEDLIATGLGSGDTPKEAVEESLAVADQIECGAKFFPANLAIEMQKKVDEVNALKGNMRF